jgi:hypothetical protein
MNDRRVASLLAVLALGAAAPVAAGDPVQTLRGKWKADMVAVTKESAVYKSLPPDEQKKMLEEWKSAPAPGFEFTDKTVVMTHGDGKPQTFTYTVLKSEGSRLSLKFVTKREDGTEDSDENVSKKGEDGALTLVRVK